MHNFKKLNTWSEAMILAKEVYQLTSGYPKEEKYGLTLQMNRCCISVPSNIAEGSSRSSNREFSHFLKIALGFLFELETQIVLSHDLTIIADNDFHRLTDKIERLQRMLNGFIIKIDREILK